MSELVCFEEAGGDCLYRWRRWPWAHGGGNGEVQLPGSFLLWRGRGDDQAGEGVMMVAMACGMGVCGGEASGVCRPVQRRHVTVRRGDCSPETKRRGLECSWWLVWHVCARTGQGEGSEGLASTRAGQRGRCTASAREPGASMPLMALMGGEDTSSPGACVHRIEPGKGQG